jgi:hypothetical protein
MPGIGISGHRGLPGQTQKLVDAALREVLMPHAGPDLIGISCLAGGPDQLLARAVLELGASWRSWCPPSTTGMASSGKSRTATTS